MRLTVFTAEDDLTLTHALADATDAIATRYFRQPSLHAQAKADGSPVTNADRLVEAALREQLLRHRPGDTFVGEESGTHGHGRRRWFVDPIDGTAGFIAGRPDWRTLIAVEHSGTISMGLVSSPALHRRWWATRAGGAWTRHYGGAPYTPDASDAEPTPLAACSAQTHPRERTDGQPPTELSTATGTRHGALLVAAGQIDAFLLAGGGPWDLAALVPIVEEAGGRFSDVAGGRSLDAPAALFTNGVLHEQILHCLYQDPHIAAG